MPKFVDVHCHLEHKAFDKDVDAVIQRAVKSGISMAVNAGSNLEANKKILGLKKRFPRFLKCVLGLSPHDAPAADLEKEIAFVRKSAVAREIVGVGEIGLDFHYFKEQSNRDKQLTAFNAFLDLAEDLSLPAVVHSREAEDLVIKTLKKRKCVRVLHCFYQPSLLKKALDAQCFISVPTIKSPRVVTVIEQTPIDRLLCETDSPFLWWDGRNEPANVCSVYKQVAVVKNIELSEAAEKINSNVEKVFGNASH